MRSSVSGWTLLPAVNEYQRVLDMDLSHRKIFCLLPFYASTKMVGLLVAENSTQIPRVVTLRQTHNRTLTDQAYYQ